MIVRKLKTLLLTSFIRPWLTWASSNGVAHLLSPGFFVSQPILLRTKRNARHGNKGTRKHQQLIITRKQSSKLANDALIFSAPSTSSRKINDASSFCALQRRRVSAKSQASSGVPKVP